MSRGASQRSNDNFSVLLAIECYFQGVRRVVNIVSPVCTILVARRSAAFRVKVLRAGAYPNRLTPWMRLSYRGQVEGKNMS